MINICYIATGKYFEYFPVFFDSLHHLCPEEKKRVFIYTDKSKWDDALAYVALNDNIILELIELKPWPITALLKFHYVFEVVNNSNESDHIFFFNASTKFMKDIRPDQILLDKLIAVPHHAWEIRGRDVSVFTWNRLDEKSKAYIPTNDYTYIQSNIFGGPKNLMDHACKEIIQWTDYDLAHNRIPIWHDESYWNKYIYTYPNNVITLPQAFNVAEEVKEELEANDPYIMYVNSKRTQADKDKFFE